MTKAGLIVEVFLQNPPPPFSLWTSPHLIPPHLHVLFFNLPCPPPPPPLPPVPSLIPFYTSTPHHSLPSLPPSPPPPFPESLHGDDLCDKPGVTHENVLLLYFSVNAAGGGKTGREVREKWQVEGSRTRVGKNSWTGTVEGKTDMRWAHGGERQRAWRS